MNTEKFIELTDGDGKVYLDPEIIIMIKGGAKKKGSYIWCKNERFLVLIVNESPEVIMKLINEKDSAEKR